ncbi:hypothetical protein A6E01_19575 (plasmid) [Vibrio breoganii]|uniref:Uncharacterized protein n=1 Tax=Vibrio breoganii TaxID=553239 RepID=A0AAN0XZA6_9VIBR|nr:hypothetical protein [Vibrio breoganii]ANO35415.1 hypothetical protein A6E01_19575 [Vibrio breoganii]
METVNEVAGEKISKIMTECGAFFAFGQEQLSEGLAKSKAAGFSGVAKDYVRTAAGMIAPRSTVKACKEQMNQAYVDAMDAIIAKYGRKAVIRYQFSNYECYYSGDPDDAIDALLPYGFTKEEILAEF